MATTSFTLCTLALVMALAATAGAEILNPVGDECRWQIERVELSSCRNYLRESSRFDESGGWREEFPDCCDALEQINDPQCRCQAVNKAVEEEKERGGIQGMEMREMLETARSLPSLCRISPRHFCDNISPPISF